MAEDRTPFDGSLVLSPGCVIYIGPGGVAETHVHHAVQLVVAREAPFRFSLDGPSVPAYTALVPAGVAHALDARGAHVAIVLFERHGPYGRVLDRLARDGLSHAQHDQLLAQPFPTNERAVEAVKRWSAILVGDSRTSAPSREVRRAIAELGRRLAHQESAALPDIAATVGLSATRLTHRFSAEVGIPFRAFVPWLRVARAVREVQVTREAGLPPNLTRAAIAAGFVDSAHLTRSFRALFGMPPSLVLSLARLSGFDEDAR
jgi:AraC-like DNA-binding protein